MADSEKASWMPLLHAAVLFFVVWILAAQQLDIVPSVQGRNRKAIEDLQRQIVDLQRVDAENKKTLADRQATFDGLNKWIKSHEESKDEFDRRKAEHEKNVQEIENRKRGK